MVLPKSLNGWKLRRGRGGIFGGVLRRGKDGGGGDGSKLLVV
jgi:hypothetical protein